MGSKIEIQHRNKKTCFCIGAENCKDMTCPLVIKAAENAKHMSGKCKCKCKTCHDKGGGCKSDGHSYSHLDKCPDCGMKSNIIVML